MKWIQRIQFKNIKKNLFRKEILLLIGARQVGKTTLLKQLNVFLEEEQHLTYFFTLEDPQILNDFNEHPERIFEYVPKNKDRLFILIDEIQYLKNPSNFLKYLFDEYQETMKLIVTGSSAFYMNQNFRDSLAGRKRIFEILPFRFSEFLLAKKEKSLSEKIQTPSFLKTREKRSFLKQEKKALFLYWQEYILYGSYPAVVLEREKEEKKEILKDLVQSYLKKDIYEAGIQEELIFYNLIKILASQIGQLINVNELSRTLKISHEKLSYFLYILQKSYIVGVCSPFYKNIRKELTKMSKLYFLDTGYRNTILKSFQSWQERIDQGSLLENSYYIEYKKNACESIQFWRTQDKNELDFIIEDTFAFEVKVNPAQFRISKYKNFLLHYPKMNLQLVTLNHTKNIDIFDILN